VHQSGGHIEVKSEPDRGSRFRIFFPHADGPLAPVKSPAAPAPPHGQETLLVLEDDPLVRRLTCTLLEDAGYRVLSAATAKAALALAERQPGAIHLLLCDVVLPEMGGPEAAAKLTALRPGIRLLFTSGYPGGMAGRTDLQATGARLLGKPFTRHDLLHSVREILDGEIQTSSPVR
jgi:CheY-like chemotaxis protein